jgi:predicted acyl esterase
VAQGCTVVNADMRGCGHSDGTATLLSQQEIEDTYDVIQWAAGVGGHGKLPSDGHVSARWRSWDLPT